MVWFRGREVEKYRCWVDSAHVQADGLIRIHVLCFPLYDPWANFPVHIGQLNPEVGFQGLNFCWSGVDLEIDRDLGQS